MGGLITFTTLYLISFLMDEKPGVLVSDVAARLVPHPNCILPNHFTTTKFHCVPPKVLLAWTVAFETLHFGVAGAWGADLRRGRACSEEGRGDAFLPGLVRMAEGQPRGEERPSRPGGERQ